MKIRAKHYNALNEIFENERTYANPRINFTRDNFDVLIEKLNKHSFLRSEECIYHNTYTDEYSRFIIYCVTKKADRKLYDYIKQGILFNGGDRFSIEEYVHRLKVQELENAIGAKSNLGEKSYIYPYWQIEVDAETLKADYTDLTVVADIVSTDGRKIRLLKIELADDNLNALTKKMNHLTGTGLVLCPTKTRMQKAVQVFREFEPTGTSEILFGLKKDVLCRGLIGPDFESVEGAKLQLTLNSNTDSASDISNYSEEPNCNDTKDSTSKISKHVDTTTDPDFYERYYF